MRFTSASALSTINETINERESPQDDVLRTLSFVVLPGFEPRQAEPKTAVLPLHHKTILFAQAPAHLKRHKVRHLCGIIQIFLHFFVFCLHGFPPFPGFRFPIPDFRFLVPYSQFQFPGFSFPAPGPLSPFPGYALFWPERRKRFKLSRAICATMLGRTSRVAATDSTTATISASGSSSVSNSNRWSGMARTASAL